MTIKNKISEDNFNATIGNNVLPAVFVGQVLYRKKSTRNEPSEIVEVTVGKVGKKYFYLTGLEERYPVDKETLKYTDKNYSQSNFKLYRDKQEILDRKEKERLTDVLYKHFHWSGNKHKNTLEQLKKAVEVLGLS